MLRNEFIRDGKNRIIGSKTSGFGNGDIVSRSRDGHILGHSSEKFSNTRDGQGHLVSLNQADADLLFRN